MGGASVRLAHSGGLSATRPKAELESKHLQLLAFAESSSDAFYLLDSLRDDQGRIVDFTFRYLNARAATRMQVDGKSLIGKSYRKHIGFFLSDHQFERYCEVATTGNPLTVEFPRLGAGIELYLVASPRGQARRRHRHHEH